MAGGIAMFLILLIAVPVGVIITGGIVAVIIAHVVRVDVEKSNEGSELIDLNG